MSHEKLRLGDVANDGTPGLGELATIRELHENRELEKIFSELAAVGMEVTPRTFEGPQGEAVTGAKLPARFAWLTTAAAAAAAESVTEGEAGRTAPARSTSGVVEAANLMMILDSLKEIGRRGLEVKRFKGLGEMDASQLWETTMDVTRRTLMRVTWDMASDAEALFSILMGEEVEPRRKFIEEHALEVKNLDV